MKRFSKIAVSAAATAAVSFGGIELITNLYAEKSSDVRTCASVLGSAAVKTSVVPKPCQTFEDVFTSKTSTADIFKDTGGVVTKRVTKYNLPASVAFKKSELAYVRNANSLNEFFDYSAPILGGLAVGGFIASVTSKPSKSEAVPASQITTSEA